MFDYGTVKPGSTLRIPINTFSSNDPSASVTATTWLTSDCHVHKDGGTTQRASSSGETLSIDFDTVAGGHILEIDLADNTTAGFYAAGSEYHVRIEGVTVDGGAINSFIARWRIGYPGALLDTTIATLSSQTSFTLTKGPAEADALNGMWCIIHDVASEVQFGYALISDYAVTTKTVTLVAGTTFTAATTDSISIMGLAPLQPTTLGATLDVTATGAAGIDWGNVENKTTANDLTQTDIQLCDTTTAVTNGVTLANGAVTDVSLAGNMEIVFETDFATNYNTTRNAWATNAQDFVGTSAADPFNGQVVAASVTGAVGSVTGSVGSVTGAVGSVTGAVGSVAGNVDGTVASVVTKTGYALVSTGADLILKSSTFALAMADAIWDEAVAGHVAAGSFGATDAAILVDTNSLNDTKIPQTLNLTALGNIGIDWANVENPTTALDLSATDIQLVDTVTTYTGNTKQTADHTANIASILTDTGTTLEARFTGMTSLTEWLSAIAGKQASDATAQTEMRAGGAGSGTYDATTDSQEAISDTSGGDATAANQTTILAKLLAYVRLMTRSDAGPTTDDATELTAINADSGAGAGDFVAGDTLESIRDNIVSSGTTDVQITSKQVIT